MVRGIYGRVTARGAAAPGISLQLRFNNGTMWSTAALTTTDADGRYSFSSVPGLGPGQEYYVLFGPNTTNPDYLYDWGGPLIRTYVAGTDRPGGDFDIADVKLLAPPADAIVVLPVTFMWQRRGIPGDTYRLVLFDPIQGDWWLTGDLGDADSFTVTALPPGATFRRQYGWFVRVYHGVESYGSSFYYLMVTFMTGASPQLDGTPDGLAHARSEPADTPMSPEGQGICARVTDRVGCGQ